VEALSEAARQAKETAEDLEEAETALNELTDRVVEAGQQAAAADERHHVAGHRRRGRRRTAKHLEEVVNGLRANEFAKTPSWSRLPLTISAPNAVPLSELVLDGLLNDLRY
jgi:hypothetical protein